MEALLVVNAGSSSLKFQLFGVEGGMPVRLYRGQIDGIGVRPKPKVQDADGEVVEDRAFETDALADPRCRSCRVARPSRCLIDRWGWG